MEASKGYNLKSVDSSSSFVDVRRGNIIQSHVTSPTANDIQIVDSYDYDDNNDEEFINDQDTTSPTRRSFFPSIASTTATSTSNIPKQINSQNLMKIIKETIEAADKDLIDKSFDENKKFEVAVTKIDATITHLVSNWEKIKKMNDVMKSLPHLYIRSLEYHIELEHVNTSARVAREFLYGFPNMLAPYCSLAWIYLQSNQIEEAIEVCDRGIRKFPDDASLHSLKGNAFYQKGEFKSAVRYFHKSIELSRLKSGEPAAVEKALKVWLRHSIV